MNHQPINTGAGWRCLRCKIAWDQGDAEPTECVAGDEYGFVTDLPPEPVVQEAQWFASLVKDMHERDIHVVDPTTLTEYQRSFLPFTPPTSEAPDPMKRQVQGTHYKALVIQPTEFCMRNGLDFCIGSILKYATRHRAKNGREDLLKANHFVEIREAFPWHIRQPGRIEITMLEYVTRNSVRPDDAEVLYRLEAYYNGTDDHTIGARRLIEQIDSLIAITY